MRARVCVCGRIYIYSLKQMLVSVVVEIAQPFNFQCCKFFRVAVKRRFIPSFSATDTVRRFFIFNYPQCMHVSVSRKVPATAQKF